MFSDLPKEICQIVSYSAFEKKCKIIFPRSINSDTKGKEKTPNIKRYNPPEFLVMNNNKWLHLIKGRFQVVREIIWGF